MYLLERLEGKYSLGRKGKEREGKRRLDRN